MPVQTHESYAKLVAWARTRVPTTVQMDLHRLKEDDAVRERWQ